MEMIVVGNIVSQVKREMSNSGFIVGTVFSEIENYMLKVEPHEKKIKRH